MAQVLSHILQRVRANPTVRLPCLALLELLRGTPTPFVVNFSRVFLDIGIPRLLPEDQAVVVPAAMRAAAAVAHAPALQGALLGLAVRSLHHVRVPQGTVQQGATGPLLDDPTVVDLVLDYMLDWLVLVPGGEGTAEREASAPAAMASVGASGGAGGSSAHAAAAGSEAEVPAGLSRAGWERLRCVTPWPSQQQAGELKVRRSASHSTHCGPGPAPPCSTRPLPLLLLSS